MGRDASGGRALRADLEIGQPGEAPPALLEALINALDIEALYLPERQQATIWATLTDTTPPPSPPSSQTTG